MKQVLLNTGYKMPLLGLGTWKSDEGKLYQAVRWAIKAGYQHIDCAAVYGNERTVGQALHDAINEGDISRDALFITSKLWNSKHKKADVLPALEKTLLDLQLDYLDLYLIHWPIASNAAGEPLRLSDVPLTETWKEMEKQAKSGLIRSIGVSNFSIKKIKEIMQNSETVPAVNQIEAHPFLVQEELVDFCEKNTIAVTAYAPLGSGDRPSGMKESHEPSLLKNPLILSISERMNVTPAQMLLAWGMARGMAVIPKSTDYGRIEENLNAVGVPLLEEDVKKISALDKHFRYVTGKGFVNEFYPLEDIWDEPVS